MKLEKKAKNFIEKFKLLEVGMGVVVGLSGGADSVALLEVLCSLQESYALRLVAVHVHHGIRSTAQADADFCRELCEKKNVKFYCEYVDVPGVAKAQGISEEEAGRNARYRLFEQYRKQLGMDVIAVAHHQNDQAETMLFQLFRGSGLRGLSGMQPRREYVIRPLLGVSRVEIEAYLMEQGEAYVTDETNATNTYSRNKIRHQVMPVAEEISAGAAEHMSQTAGQLRDVLLYMEQQAERFLCVHAEKEEVVWKISVQALQQEHPALQKMVVTEAIAGCFASRKDITEKHITAILELLEKEGEKTVHLPKGGLVKKSYDWLIFQREESEEETLFTRILIEPNRRYALPDGSWLETRLIEKNNLENIPVNDCIKWLDYDRITESIFLRTREEGDFLTVRDDGTRKSVNDYMINEKIPRSERDSRLLLADGHHIIWIIGKRISAHYKVTEHTEKILEVHVGGKNYG